MKEGKATLTLVQPPGGGRTVGRRGDPQMGLGRVPPLIQCDKPHFVSAPRLPSALHRPAFPPTSAILHPYPPHQTDLL